MLSISIPPPSPTRTSHPANKKYSPLSPLALSISQSTIGSVTGWYTKFARDAVLEVARQGVKNGQLTIVDSTGTHIFGDASARPASPSSPGATPKPLSVSVVVLNDAFWARVVLGGDLGFSEAYLVGDIEISDLKGVVDLWLDNRSTLTHLSGLLAKTINTFSMMFTTFLGQTMNRARLNVIASYDTSNALFQAFLSKEMQYSCALWSDEENGPRGDLTVGPFDGDLEAAQKRKLHHVLKTARVKPGDRVLEVGSGWGALAITAAQSYGCIVDTLTLSVEQKKLAEERIAAAGLSDRVTVHLMDYRDLPKEKKDFEHVFDAFVSIEMVEHVGAKHYGNYFKVIDWALKKENATAVVTGTTFPEARYSQYQEEDFIRRYMWPNSSFPAPTTLINAASTSSHNKLLLETVENHGAHYPRTLRTWNRRLDENLMKWRDQILADQPALEDPLEFEAFLRKWRYMFVYAGAGFAKGYITCHMLSWRREDMALPECD